MKLEERIKTRAKQLGFCLCGITAPQRPPHFGVYQRWLEQNRHGGMDYLARPPELERRRDPASLLPGTRSILVLALPYRLGTAGSQRIPPIPYGRIAAYALGLDYHNVMPPLLDELAGFIRESTGVTIQSRVYTDTGAILERDFATLAGLGWIGKNTCLIAPEYGSYLLLGEILLDYVLEPDPPFAFDRCGSCQRCIQVCPTGCILPDRTIDARRCISYLTIENKRAIPRELRSSVGEWIFGCDICQNMCPWNAKTHPESVLAEFSPLPAIVNLSLSEEAALSPHEFKSKYRGSPIYRSKRGGFLRNIAVVMGNSRSPEFLPALERLCLAEPEPLVRAHAAWAVSQVGTFKGRQILDQALNTDPDQVVLAEIRDALDSIVVHSG